MSQDENAEIQLTFSRTVTPGQGYREIKSYVLDGKITQVIFHFPPGCHALVDMALSKDEKQFYPLQGYIALDNATPVCYVDATYYANEPLELEVRNRDAGNSHTPTCIVTIRFKKPEWW